MPHILIANCSPAAMEAQVTILGVASNAALFERALHLHDPAVVCSSINIADGDALPAGSTFESFDGIMFTGSPLHILDHTPEVMRQIEFARAAFASSVPVWGSCWGLQLATVALGGSVRRNPKGREIGIARGITVTEAGRFHPLLVGRATVFDALCSHLDEIEMPPSGADVLAGNDVSAVQAMAIRTPGNGLFFGVQYHPEITLPVVAALLQLRASRLVSEGFGRSEADLRALAEDYRALAAGPIRRDLAWRYGIGDEILNSHQHTMEIGNWLRAAVHPRRRRA